MKESDKEQYSTNLFKLVLIQNDEAIVFVTQPLDGATVGIGFVVQHEPQLQGMK
jgi:hypothetical protein